jgi:Smg protein
MYDVLVFLFENCQQAEIAYDRERVAKKLSAAGFEDSDISEALHWLAGMALTPRSVREPCPTRAQVSALTRRASWRNLTPSAAASCSRSSIQAS